MPPLSLPLACTARPPCRRRQGGTGTRHVPAKAQVLIVNLFLGWTMIGWMVAMMMAFRPVPRADLQPSLATAARNSAPSRHLQMLATPL